MSQAVDAAAADADAWMEALVCDGAARLIQARSSRARAVARSAAPVCADADAARFRFSPSRSRLPVPVTRGRCPPSELPFLPASGSRGGPVLDVAHLEWESVRSGLERVGHPRSDRHVTPPPMKTGVVLGPRLQPGPVSAKAPPSLTAEPARACRPAAAA